MLNSLQAYSFDAHALRTLIVAGEPWFVATDVAAILGYRDAPNLVRRLDEDEADTRQMSSSGQGRELLIISESGLYNAIFGSKKPEAQAFRKWVTSEVLPSIRRTGTFTMGEGDPLKRMTAALKLVGEARRLQGKGAAIEIWNQLGLPPMPEAEIATDPMEEPLLEWLGDRKDLRIIEALDGLSIEDRSETMRKRIGQMLRRHGWTAKTERIGERTHLVFRREA